MSKQIKCMYCGVELKDGGACAEDYGLHTPYITDFYDKRVCPRCDMVVTRTNRILKGVIDSNFEPHTLVSLEEHVKMIRNHFSQQQK